jgi:hypothetical protein
VYDAAESWPAASSTSSTRQVRLTHTNQCAVLIGAIGLHPDERPFTWIETLLDRAAQANELVGAW